MPTPQKLKAIFYPEEYYHIVCKSIDGLLLFDDGQDYEVYNERFKKFTGDFFDVWCFCLIPNHSHHIIKIKSVSSVSLFIEAISLGDKTMAMKDFTTDVSNELLFNKMIERQMNSFLVSYANYVNNKYYRKGGIFQKPFKRIKIEGDGHLQQAIIYVHANAQKHKMIADYKQYNHSSYASVIKKNEYFVDAKSVVDFFGGLNKFIDLHELQVDYFYKNNWPSSKLE